MFKNYIASYSKEISFPGIYSPESLSKEYKYKAENFIDANLFAKEYEIYLNFSSEKWKLQKIEEIITIQIENIKIEKINKKTLEEKIKLREKIN